jgi:hypothetical protein
MPKSPDLSISIPREGQKSNFRIKEKKSIFVFFSPFLHSTVVPVFPDPRLNQKIQIFEIEVGENEEYLSA